jgi:hypothetical protein
MKSCLRLFALLFVLSFFNQAWALSTPATLQEELELLRQVPRSYEDSGAICEEVARLQVAKSFAEPLYSVVTGIAYGTALRTVGELDIIVFDNNTHKVIRIGEVKCWKKLDEGLVKAKDQRQRFLGYKQSHKITFVRSTSEGKGPYTVDQFEYVKDFVSIAQQGAKGFGFDEELEYSLKDLMTLRQMMILCQEKGECAKAH